MNGAATTRRQPPVRGASPVVGVALVWLAASVASAHVPLDLAAVLQPMLAAGLDLALVTGPVLAVAASLAVVVLVS